MSDCEELVQIGITLQIYDCVYTDVVHSQWIIIQTKEIYQRASTQPIYSPCITLLPLSLNLFDPNLSEHSKKYDTLIIVYRYLQ